MAMSSPLSIFRLMLINVVHVNARKIIIYRLKSTIYIR